MPENLDGEITGTLDGDQCTLMWNPVYGAVCYYVYRDDTFITEVSTNIICQTNSMLVPQTDCDYTFKVKAFYDEAGNASTENTIIVNRGSKHFSTSQILDKNGIYFNVDVDTGTFDVHGKKVKVYGAFNQNNDSVVCLDGGSIYVKGDYTVKDTSKIIMNNNSDYIAVDGSFYFKTSVSHQLDYSSSAQLMAGTIEVKGLFKKENDSTVFVPGGSHKVALSGLNDQTIDFNNDMSSKFNILEINKPIERYHFAPAGRDIATWYNFLINGQNSKAMHGIEGIYAPSGNFCRTYTDMALPAPGMDIVIGRTYNSTYEKDYTPTRGWTFGKGWTFSHEGNMEDSGNKKIVRLPGGNTLTFSYVNSTTGPFTADDSRAKLEYVTVPDIGYKLTMKDHTVYGFDSNRWLRRIEDKNGNRISIEVDTNGRVTSVADKTGRQFDISYNTDSLISSITDSTTNRHIDYNYENGNLVTVTDTYGNIVNYYRYNLDGYLVEIKDDLEQTTDTFSYNSNGRISSCTDSFGNSYTYVYSGDAQNMKGITTITDKKGRVTSQEYDGSLGITKNTDADGRATVIEYSLEGGVNKYREERAVTDRSGNVTTYDRDGNGNVIRITNPDSSYKDYGYDSNDNLIFERDESGSTTVYNYDNNNLIVKAKYLFLPTATQAVTPTPTPTGTVSATPVIIPPPTINIDRNSDGTKTAENNETGYAEITRYTYDTNGLLTSITDIDDTNNPPTVAPTGLPTPTPDCRYGMPVSYNYDSDYNLTSVTDQLGNTTKYAYNDMRLKTAELSPEGYLTRYVYDDNGRLEKTTLHMCSNPYSNPPMDYPASGYTYSLLLHDHSSPDVYKYVTITDKTKIYGTDAGDGNYSITFRTGATVRQWTWDRNSWSTPSNQTYNSDTQLPGSYCLEDCSFNLKDGSDNTLKCYNSVTRITYDTQDRKKKEVTPELYDPEEDGLNDSTPAHDYRGDCGYRYTYHVSGKVESLTDPEGNTTSYTYDNYGNIKSRTQPNLLTYEYGYDEINRPSRVSYIYISGSEPVTLEEYSYAVLPDKKTQKTHTQYLNDGFGILTVDGSFENDDNSDGLADGWSKTGGETSMSGDIKAFGNKSQEVTSTSSYANISTVYSTTIGHKYMFAGYYYQKNRDAADIYTKVKYQFMTIAQAKWADSTELNKWLRAGVVFTAVSSAVTLMPCEIWSANCEVYVDGWRLIDLTNLYGAGNEPESVDAAMNTADSFYTYDYAGRQVMQVNPDGGTVTANYNANGTADTVTDACGNTTHYNYDCLSRPTEQWTPFESVNGTTKYTYTKSEYFNNGWKWKETTGKVTTDLGTPVTDTARLVTKTYAYLRDGKTSTISDSEGKKTVKQYDSDGNLSLQDVYTDTVNKITTVCDNNCFGKPSQSKLLVKAGEIMYSDGSTNASDEYLETDYTYDKNGNAETETAPDRSAPGTASSRVTTTYVYDSLNRVTDISQPGRDEYYTDQDNTTITGSKEYYWDGQLKSTTDPNGNKTEYNRNRLGRLYQVKNTVDINGTPTDHITEYYYDRAGRKTAEVSPKNYDSSKILSQMNRIEYAYDPVGRLKVKTDVYQESQFDPIGSTWGMPAWVKVKSKSYKYDKNGNILKELDALGFEAGTGNTDDEKIESGYGTEYTYNMAGKTVTVLDAVSADRSMGYTYKYEYDALGRKTKETDGANKVTNYSYEYEFDALGNVIYTETIKTAVINTAEQRLQVSTYDMAGNLAYQTDYYNSSSGNTTAYTYNAMNKVKSAVYPGDASIPSNTVTYYYDTMGNLKKQQDTLGTVDLYEYDNQGRILSHTQQKQDGTEGITTSAKYDRNGNSRFETDGNGNTTAKTYDGLNRLTSSGIDTWDSTQTNCTTHLTAYGYDKNGNRTTVTDWRGNTYTNTYDPINRLTEKDDPFNKGIEKLEYNHNNSQIKSYDVLNNLTQYTYDKNNRQLSEIDPEHIDKPEGDPDYCNHTTSRTYDNAGNIATKTDGRGNTVTYAYDDLNRLEQVINAKGETTGYTYDLSGNLLTITDGRNYVTTYEYNAVSRIKKKYDNGGLGIPARTETYTYKANGLLETKTDRNGYTTTYGYDGNSKDIRRTEQGIDKRCTQCRHNHIHIFSNCIVRYARCRRLYTVRTLTSKYSAIFWSPQPLQKSRMRTFR